MKRPALLAAMVTMATSACWGTAGERVSLENTCEGPVRFALARAEAEPNLDATTGPGETIEITAVQAAADDSPFVLYVASEGQSAVLTASVETDAEVERVTLDESACRALGESRACDLDVSRSPASFSCDE